MLNYIEVMGDEKDLTKFRKMLLAGTEIYFRTKGYCSYIHLKDCKR